MAQKVDENLPVDVENPLAKESIRQQWRQQQQQQPTTSIEKPAAATVAPPAAEDMSDILSALESNPLSFRDLVLIVHVSVWMHSCVAGLALFVCLLAVEVYFYS